MVVRGMGNGGTILGLQCNHKWLCSIYICATTMAIIKPFGVLEHFLQVSPLHCVPILLPRPSSGTTCMCVVDMSKGTYPSGRHLLQVMDCRGHSKTQKKIVPVHDFSKTTACSPYVPPWLVAIGGRRLVEIAGWWLVVGGGWQVVMGGWWR